MERGEQPANTGPFWRRWWRVDPIRQEREAAAYRLYDSIVDRSRAPGFFTTLGIPDTTEGRFEVLALHAAVVMRRLKAEGEPGKALAQAVFDRMFEDVDASLRELGIGDMSIGKYVKRFARQFYARIEVLDQTLASDDRARLRPFLTGNVWRGGRPPSPQAVDRLIDYLHALVPVLDASPSEDLLSGRLELEAVSLK